MEFVRQILMKLKTSSNEGLLMKVFSHSLMWLSKRCSGHYVTTQACTLISWGCVHLRWCGALEDYTLCWGAIGNRLAIGRQPIGDWSAISRRLKTVSGLSATAATGRRSVTNQSATCRRPPKTFLRSIWSQRGFTCSNQNLLATKSSL